jgi:hypothetical protein
LPFLVEFIQPGTNAQPRTTASHISPPGQRARRGIQSDEVGGQLLLALADQGRPMALKDLAQTAGTAPAKAHPYLVSFGKLGLIEPKAPSGRYGARARWRCNSA